jgi:hypothetical protein
MTREVSRENSQAAEDKDPRAVRPDQAVQPDPNIFRMANLEISQPQHFTIRMDDREVLRIEADGTLIFADATEAAAALHEAWVTAMKGWRI